MLKSDACHIKTFASHLYAILSPCSTSTLSHLTMSLYLLDLSTEPMVVRSHAPERVCAEDDFPPPDFPLHFFWKPVAGSELTKTPSGLFLYDHVSILQTWRVLRLAVSLIPFKSTRENVGVSLKSAL